MTHLDLRHKFLDFWAKPPRNHVQIPSSSLVPENDPTTLFTGSGMQPLIPYLLGQPHPLGTRLVDIQKCFRGQDIDAVGDNRHDTFFEMMGNWSLGDYFKEKQLAWYFEFLTKVLGFNPQKLYISCFEGYKNIPKDTESTAIWKSLGIPEERIFYYGVDHNWWSRSGAPDKMPVGEIGGPDSEVYYEFDIPHDKKFGPECHPACECGKYLEIGNSVFIQYQKKDDGTFKELPQKNVDFGGGLERTLAAFNNNPDIFATEMFYEAKKTLEALDLTDTPESKRSIRIVLDHLRSALFLIDAGVLPSNKDRGYILRRLIRKAALHSKISNIDLTSELSPILNSFNNVYSGVYPSITNNQKFIFDTIEEEFRKFEQMLRTGIQQIGKSSSFDLYQTYGFPPEIIEELYKEKGLKFDKESFKRQLEKHKELSRAASTEKFKGGLANHSDQVVKYHTATHLLHAALRNILGDHVHQEGSNITAERLRFDFSHPAKLTPEEVKKIEELVNVYIQKNLERSLETLSYNEAIDSGALAFFKERYPEKVTVYTFKDNTGKVYSREICGGPHVENTKDLGRFKIIKEESVAAGIRRIYAALE